MKKIMFNDRYGLTQAVLEGKKTMTRRMCPSIITPNRIEDVMPIYSKYKVGEVVAVAQSGIYILRTIQEQFGEDSEQAISFKKTYGSMAMWNNKMFTPAVRCPHQIKITGRKVERLQDISNEDCLKEGIWVRKDGMCVVGDYALKKGRGWSRTSLFHSPRSAFAALIDKTCGRGTWEKNPYVFAYEFELVK